MEGIKKASPLIADEDTFKEDTEKVLVDLGIFEAEEPAASSGKAASKKTTASKKPATKKSATAKKEAVGTTSLGSKCNTQSEEIDKQLLKGKPKTVKQLADATELTEARIKQHLYHLINKRDFAVEVSEGKYSAVNL